MDHQKINKKEFHNLFVLLYFNELWTRPIGLHFLSKLYRQFHAI